MTSLGLDAAAAGEARSTLTVADAMAALGVAFPAALVGRSAEHLGTLAMVPGDWEVISAECRLEDGCDRADFAICIRAAPARRGAWLRWVEGMGGGEAWSRCAAFLRVWRDPGSPLADAVPAVWIELDAGATTLEPFLICTVDRAVAAATGGDPSEVYVRALRLLSRRDVDVATRRRLADCLDALPTAARRVHCAARPVGNLDVVRVVAPLPPQRIVPFLAAMGWPGESDALQAWLDATCRQTLTHAVNIDIVDGALGPRVGIEYYYPTPPAADARWRVLLDALAAAGACTPEKRAALEAWPTFGTQRVETGLLRAERELLVKVVYEDGAPLRAKAYLPFAARLNLR